MRFLQVSARVILALWLAIAPVYAGSMTLLGAGKVGATSTPFGFTFIVGVPQPTPTGGTQCDFGSPSLGATDPTRQSPMVLGGRFTTAASVVSLTVNGVAATAIPSAAGSAASAANVTLFNINTSALGTTTPIVATYNNTILRCELAIYRLVGTTATVNSGNGTSGTGTVSSLSSTGLSIPSGGAAFGGSVSATAASGGSTSLNLTQDVNTLIGGTTTLFQAGSTSTGSGAATFTFNYNVAQSQAAAAWTVISP